jgi:rubrerythrin
MHLSSYLGLLETGCATLAQSYRQVAEGHVEEADVKRICEQFAAQCDQHEELLRPFTKRYGSHPSGEPERLNADGLSETRSGGLGLLRDLHDLYLLASYLDMAWTLVGQAAKGARDQELIETVEQCAKQTEAQQQWLTTRLKSAAPQALLVAD